ncbi:hypothetical protein GYH30_022553 [Glycine max]|uniref:Uncharacterized protein n=2 Tax=Glycine subgen. Soja TaxID=1462606 RepID=K7L963_SOYBN|nr:hypothetical protein GYH30_022553 [Glycine max]
MSHSHLNSLSSNCSSSMELEIGATHTDQTLEPWFPSDTSTGYLQDAIAGRGIWCKEQNLLSCSKDQKVDEFPMFSTTTAHPLHGMYALVSFSIYVQQFHCQLIINHQCVLLFFDFC